MTELNSFWPTVPLGTLAAEMCLGKMLDKNKNRGTLHPYLRNVNVRWFTFDLDDLKEMRFEPGEEVRFGLREGDLVICEGGEPGRAAVWRGQAADARIQKALHRVRFRPDEYDPSFAMYFLYYSASSPSFSRYYTGTTIKHLTGESLAQIPFPLPTLKEQRRIVAKLEELLSDLDAGVAALKRAKVNLKRYRAAVLKAAVEGRLTAEWRAKNPHAEPAATLLDRILAERRRRWEAEQVERYRPEDKSPPKGWQERYRKAAAPDTVSQPSIPPTWAVASLDQLVTRITSGSRDWSKYYDRGTGTFVMAQNVRPGKLDLTFRQAVDPPVDDRDRDRSQIEDGDVLITIVGANTGDVCRVKGTYPEHYVCQSVALVRPVDPRLAPFIEAYLMSPEGGQRQFQRYIYGQGRPHLGFDELRLTAIPLPPVEEQTVILQEVERQWSLFEQLETEIESYFKRIHGLRRGILKQAFEGKLVPQDPSDEPASVLLERIRADRQPAAGTGAAPPKARRPRKEPR